MFRKLLAAALIGLGCAATSYADDAKKPADDKKPGGKFGGFDRGKIFDKMDANGDGKVTKDEYVKSVEAMAAKLKEKGGKGAEFAGKMAEGAGKRFDAIDADKKGEITKEQFEKSSGFGGPGGFRGKGRGKPPEKKPAD